MEMALCDKNSGNIIFKTQGPFLYFSIREAENSKMIKDSLHWSFEDRFGFPFARKENNFYHSFKIPFACFPTLFNEKYRGIVHYTIQQEQEIKINVMNSTLFFNLKDMDKCLKSNLRKIIFNKVQQLQRPNDFLETTSKLEVSKFVDWRDIIDSMTNLVPNMPIDALDPDHYISDPERLDDFLKLEEELVNSIVGIENIPDKEGFYRFRDLKKSLNFLKDLFMETVEIHQIQKEKMESFLHIKL